MVLEQQCDVTVQQDCWAAVMLTWMVLSLCLIVPFLQVRKKLEEVKQKKQEKNDDDYLPDGIDRYNLISSNDPALSNTAVGSQP
jgi:hypothetical protein